MLSDYGCAREIKYAHYVSKAPELGIQMDYPAGWICLERQDAKAGYVNVFFSEPGKGPHLKATMMVTAKKISTLKPEMATLESFTRGFTSARLKSKDAKVLSQSPIRIIGLPAFETRISYQAPDEIYAVKANFLPIKEHIIVFQRKDTFYIVRYRNKEEEFNNLDGVFTHCIKTIKFKDA